MLILAEIGFVIWFYEAVLWVTVWFYYGLVLALRWCWRRNPIGQTVDTATAVRERRQPTNATEHIDLGRLSDRGRAS